MALIVEDGTGKPDAESYCTVVFADAYHAGRANSAWAALGTPAKEANLRIATDFIESTYAGRWLGLRFSHEQALSWPRNYVQIADGPAVGDFMDVAPLPLSLQRACAELAGRAAAGALSTDVASTIKEKRLGPATFKYATYDRVQAAQSAADRILFGLCLRSGFGQVFAERA